jgi:hypothetical protein
MSIQFPFLAIKGESKIFFFPLSSYTTKCPGIRFRGTGMIGGGVRPKGVDPINTTYPTFSRSIKFIDFYPFADIETITSRLRLFMQLYTLSKLVLYSSLGIIKYIVAIINILHFIHL